MASSHTASRGLVRTLIKEFKAYHCYRGDNHGPPWAWPYVPSIPFVGHRYAPGRGMLVYASAENFTWMNRNKAPARYTDRKAWNRYRAAYEDVGRRSDTFFPNVGIQPFNDGGLPSAALFAANKLGLPVSDTPRDFVETLAISNWAKFTILGDENVDYVDDRPKLGSSLPFVLAELLTLKPALVLVPHRIYAHKVFRAAMHGVLPDARFVPVPQFNTTVVNRHLSTHHRKGLLLRKALADEAIGVWMQNLQGFNRSNAWRYLAMLDTCLARSAE